VSDIVIEIEDRYGLTRNLDPGAAAAALNSWLAYLLRGSPGLVPRRLVPAGLALANAGLVYGSAKEGIRAWQDWNDALAQLANPAPNSQLATPLELEQRRRDLEDERAEQAMTFAVSMATAIGGAVGTIGAAALMGGRTRGAALALGSSALTAAIRWGTSYMPNDFRLWPARQLLPGVGPSQVAQLDFQAADRVAQLRAVPRQTDIDGRQGKIAV